MDAPADQDLVTAAQAGDQRALDQLLRAHLPLLYNVVGRALNGHADVDDVVQETLIQAADRLRSLNHPDRFRSWLIAICFREIHTRSRVRSRRDARETSLETHDGRLSPDPDFVDVTILELGLTDQRRETAQATRWLSAVDRHLLALWWQEAAGTITRTELAEALGCDRPAAAVRIQRMKERLDTARIVHRALVGHAGCPHLIALLRAGPDQVADRDLNRFSPHVRRCETCAATRRRLVRPEHLLAGMGLLPLPDGLAHVLTSLPAHAPQAATASHVAAPPVLTSKPVWLTAAVASTAALVLAVLYLPDHQASRPPAPGPAALPPAPAVVEPARPPAPAPARAPAQPYEAYAMAYFTEASDPRGTRYGLHLAVSSDALHWTPLNQNEPVLTPSQGTRGLRDPFLLRKQDGTFAVLATDLNGTDFSLRNQYIHVWESPDLRTFTYHRVKLHSMPTHAWAPEAFWDPGRKRYGIIYSAGGAGREAIYVNYTADFRTVTKPALFFSPGYDVQDATLVAADGAYHLFFRDGRDGRIRQARAASPAPGSFDRRVGPHSWVQGSGVVGPLVVQDNRRERWWLWADSYAPVRSRMYAWRSTRTGDLTAWTPLDGRSYNAPLNAKQASVLPITAGQRDRLVERWRTPSWNRISSYNFPERLIRHHEKVGRTDPYPLHPFADSQWRLVPGLADPAGVSFRSVNYPGHYLSDTGNGVVLAADTGARAFRRSATFIRTRGLADPGFSSFRSSVDPAGYLRHRHHALRVDHLRSSADRADATFSVGY